MQDRCEDYDAIVAFTAQHPSLQRLLDCVLQKEAAGARSALLSNVADALTTHIKTEEDISYPTVRAARTEEILLESIEEHLSLKRLLADLLALDPTGRLFEPKFKALKGQTERHPSITTGRRRRSSFQKSGSA